MIELIIGFVFGIFLMCCLYVSRNDELQQRIDKAIEFIEEHNIIGTNKEYLPSEIEKCYSLELMEILQGSDK